MADKHTQIVHPRRCMDYIVVVRLSCGKSGRQLIESSLVTELVRRIRIKPDVFGYLPPVRRIGHKRKRQRILYAIDGANCTPLSNTIDISHCKPVSETTFLNGKVRKFSLPVFNTPPPGGRIGPKRLLLAQGELANFYDGDEGIRYIALIEMRLGQVRGNHVHQVKDEQVYVLSGQLLLVAQDGGAGEKVSFDVAPGDLVSIATGVAHAIKPVKAGYAIEFSKARFDPSDSQKVILI